MSPLEIPANDPRPTLNYPLHETGLHKTLVALARLVFRPLMKLQVRGLESLPATGAAIIAANHLSEFDVFPLQLALPRMLFFMGKAELFQFAPLHAVFRLMGGFPVYRGERDEWALEHSRRVLSAGQLLAMFPEGTRSQGKGLGVAKTGAARLALEMNVPLVMVAISGSERFFADFPRPRQVTVTLAPPLFPRLDESPMTLTDRMMFTLSANLPPDLRGVYSDLPKGFHRKN